MNVALIDLGTNSARIDIQQISDRGDVTRLVRNKVMVRLGQGLFETKKLQPDAISRTLSTLKEFRALCDEHHVQKIIGVAISLDTKTNQS